MAPAHRWSARPAALAACLMLVAAGVTASAGPRQVVVVLQMNLCASGYAGCYTGRSVQQAASLVQAHSPDVVTVNEACRDGMPALAAAMRRAWPGWAVSVAFQPVTARPTNQPVHCRNGAEFGVGVLARLRQPAQTAVAGDAYPVQDSRDPERRVWLCLRALGRFTACTTHLAIDVATAFAQCEHLLGEVLPGFGEPALVSGDFNLLPDALRGCVPAGWVQATDGGLQHLVASGGYTVISSTRLGMAGTTDHPALLVTLSDGSRP